MYKKLLRTQHNDCPKCGLPFESYRCIAFLFVPMTATAMTMNQLPSCNWWRWLGYRHAYDADHWLSALYVLTRELTIIGLNFVVVMYTRNFISIVAHQYRQKSKVYRLYSPYFINPICIDWRNGLWRNLRSKDSVQCMTVGQLLSLRRCACVPIIESSSAHACR